MPYVRKTKKRRSITKGAKLTAATSCVVAAGLVLSGLYLQHQEELAATAAEAATYEAPTATAPAETATLTTNPADLIAGKDDLTISILGDSTGDEADEWVSLWADHLAENATISVRVWDAASNAYSLNVDEMGAGDRRITIWNGSQNGTAPDYALERFGQIQPQDPDLVILNYGHNPISTPYPEALTELRSRIENRWGQTPTVATLQNSARGTREGVSTANRAAIEAWAEENALTLIDAHGATEAAGGAAAMLEDEVHPNPEGSRVWADQVIAALG